MPLILEEGFHGDRRGGLFICGWKPRWNLKGKFMRELSFFHPPYIFGQARSLYIGEENLVREEPK